jgi:hypothetical protein
MQSPIFLAIGIAVGMVVGLSVRSPVADIQKRQPNDAAFRDGIFQAKLDVQSGRKPHLASGRWNTNADRALFVAGYQQGYREAFEAHAGRLPKPAAAEVAGYWDGMSDGAEHHAASRSFQPEKTNNYLNAGQDSLVERKDVAEYQREYRHAYLNGYQQGYYTQETSSSWSYYSPAKEKKSGKEPILVPLSK